MTAHWLIAAHVRDHVAGPRPVHATALDGERLVLFRTASGAVGCLQDRCCHRAVPLSVGRTHGEHLVCAYHAWEFDRTGRCRRIPSNLPSDRIPSGTCVRQYPVEEQDGFYWVWLGDDPPPPLPARLTASTHPGDPLPTIAASAIVARPYREVMESAVDQLSHVTRTLLGPETAQRAVSAAVRLRHAHGGLSWDISLLDDLRTPLASDRPDPPPLRVDLAWPNLVRATWSAGGPNRLRSLARYFVPVDAARTRIEACCQWKAGQPATAPAGSPPSALGMLSSDATFLDSRCDTPAVSAPRFPIPADTVVDAFRAARQGPHALADDTIYTVRIAD